MPIAIRHSGNAAPALVGSAVGGQGERHAQDARTLAPLFAQREARETQQQSQMMGLLKQARDANQRAFLARVDHLGDATQAAIDRQRAIDRDAAIREESRAWQLEDRAHAEERQDALAARAGGPVAQSPSVPDQFGAMGADGDFLPQLTRDEYDADPAAYNRLFAQWRAIGADDTLTDDEKTAARGDLRRQFYGLQAAPRPPADPTLAERWQKETFEFDGARYGVDKNGKWYQIPAAPAAGAVGRPADGPSTTGLLGMPQADYLRLYAQVARGMDNPNPTSVHQGVLSLLHNAGYLDDDQYASLMDRSLGVSGGDPGHAGGPPVLEPGEQVPRNSLFHPHRLDDFIELRSDLLASPPEPGTLEAALGPGSRLGEAWDRALDAEAAPPAGGPGAEPPSLPAPPAPPAALRPDSPAPSGVAPAPPAADPSRWPSGAPRIKLPGIRDTGGSLVIDGVEYPIAPQDPATLPSLRQRKR